MAVLSYLIDSHYSLFTDSDDGWRLGHGESVHQAAAGGLPAYQGGHRGNQHRHHRSRVHPQGGSELCAVQLREYGLSSGDS